MNNNGIKLIRHPRHSRESHCSRETALIQLIHDARDGDGTAVSELIESFRDYLLKSARGAISPAIQGKVAPSDLFQESFLAAEQGFPEFRGETLQ